MEQNIKIVLPEIPNLHELDVYIQNGGFNAAKKAFTQSPDDLIEQVKKSGLRGRGGAAFSAGLKWSFMPKTTDKPKYLAINGDESEPGSFKDRQIFEYNPHQLIEGILITCYAIGAKTAYIYIRGEYHKWIRLMQKALDDAYSKGCIGEKMKDTFNTEFFCDIYIHKGAGAYICGEESSLMNSLEGHRGYPRVKPPFPAQRGLWGCPTTINNVETITNVPKIIENGWEWFSKIGAEKHPGTILYGISGHVNKPGVYELPTGILLTELIYDIAGGVAGNKKIKCVIPGGSSMPPLRGDQLEGIRMDAESLKAAGSAIGTAGVMVMDEDTDLLRVLARITKFYYHESCGQCTPCREGTGWMLKTLNRMIEGNATSDDIDLLIEVANNIEGNTVCALGDAAAWPVKFMLDRFRDEFEKYVKTDVSLPVRNKVHAMRGTVVPLVDVKR
ncbi:MAG: NADH-quinone oxidoreductase subunit NuoF [Melioribacteraceae bacterium]|nr:NADH-quinone oxidoreductase subunit NuoF [Melioribacteraceae bacterium]MCF8355330.1 NADH-quinone oxidoreductase subunit NuoF [Melioribacteraceae bacterium]MCF8396339.1 NADH-quinone oxidoreductase subunit NuoF [Melioribacteraceae bacterium]MCF8420408.1 NADH-quinone oxidoreductase subunit NuoF [Melioribacteraceae bacterium]